MRFFLWTSLLAVATSINGALPTPDSIRAGSLDPALASFITANENQLSESLPATSRTAPAIVIIDPSVSDFQDLTAGVISGAEVFVLNSRGDGVAQISSAIANRRGIASLHFITHGEPGVLQLGATSLNLSNLDQYAESLRRWSESFRPNADVLLYGCEVAAGENGVAFVQRLSRLLGARVAASNDKTGNAHLGGNWNLEVATGPITAAPAISPSVMQAYAHLLQLNTVPTISAIANQLASEDISTAPILFTVGDRETLASQLLVTGTSSNTNLVPNANLTFGGSGANRTVTIQPAPNQSGISTIKITVTDALGGFASASFVLTVNAVNDAPTVVGPKDTITNEDTATGPLAFTIGDIDTPVDNLTVIGSSSNPGLAPNANIVIGGSGANRTVTIMPALNQNGKATISLIVSDGLLSTSASFVLTVNAVNDAPLIVGPKDTVINEDTATPALAFNVSDVDTPATNLTVIASSSNPTLVPNANIVLAGGVVNRTVMITPASNQSGKATISLTVSDGLLSTTDSFVLTVNAVNDPPTINNLLDVTTDEDTTTPAIAFTIGDAETAAGLLTVSGFSSHPTLVPNTNIVFGGIGANRTVTITPALNQNGKAIISVVVSDGLLTTTNSFALTVNAVNDPPTISGLKDTTTDEGTTTAAISFTIGDVDSPADSLRLTGISSNPILVPNTNVVFGGSATFRTLIITPTKGQTGSAKITINVSDGVLSDSASFVLTVVAVKNLPLITAQPFSQTVRAGDNAVVSVEATGTGLTYQWLLNGREVAGATNAVLTLIKVSFLQAGNYTVIVKNSAGSVSSRAATLTVLIPPTITKPPSGGIVTVGESVLLSVSGSGSLPVSYQWQFNGSNLVGATNQTLALKNVTPNQAGDYRVIVSNAAGTVTSAAGRLVVLVPPTITEQPQSQTVTVGTNVTFRVSVSGNGPFFYQWRLNGINLSRATNATLTLSNVQLTNSGQYSVLVAALAGTAHSSNAVLTVLADPLPLEDNFANRSRLTASFGSGRGSNRGATRESGEPTHAGKPGGKSVWISWVAPANGIATFSTRGSSFDTLLAVYSGSALSSLVEAASNDDEEGLHTSEVTFNAAAGTEYQIAVDGLGGAQGFVVLSWKFQNTILGIPLIVTLPQSLTVAQGQDITFSVEAILPFGLTLPLSYQWFFNGAPLIGSTASRLAIRNVGIANLGNYSVQIGLGTESVRTRPVHLQINFTETGAADTQVSSEDKFTDAAVFGFTPAIQLAGLTSRPVRRAGAALARGYSGTQIFSTFGSTTEEGEPNHCGVIGGASQWFSYQAERDGTLTISTEGSDFDTVLAVYTGPGTDFESLQSVSCDDNSGTNGMDSVVRFAAVSGTVYYIAVDGVNGVTGNARLSYKLDVPLRFLSVQTISGNLQLGVSGQAGGSYTVQGSTNMVDWVSILTTNTPNGAINFADPEAPGLEFRFYRAIAGQ